MAKISEYFNSLQNSVELEAVTAFPLNTREPTDCDVTATGHTVLRVVKLRLHDTTGCQTGC